ncbi:MAG: hypothetical protein ACP5J4_08040 [Anaerolineae bacterium]
MSTTKTIIGLHRNIACSPQKASTPAPEWILPPTTQCTYLGLHYIALDRIVENPGKTEEGRNRLNLGDVLLSLRGILFPDRGRETYHRLEGDDMTPITAYKSGNRYIVADGDNRLATARYLRQAFILAEVWEVP